jgi:protein-tyrosine phosphatase
MIDIHSHILWGLDDGAETIEESLAMLQVAAESGTTDIVATPHANFQYRYETEVVKQRIAEVSTGVSGRPQGVSGKPRIHRGCDFHLSFDNVQDAIEHPAKYAINDGPYLLVEFPDNSPLAGMKRVLTTLLDCGLIPIMTHPERNMQLRRINKDFLEWIQMGCLVQITAQSLLGRFGKQAEESAWRMVRRGLAHFVASDAHDVTDRPPRLDLAFEAVSSRVGESHARLLLIENPNAVISGGRVRVEIPKRKPWYRWWE